jgi:osmotically-inducible protein OsmY
MELNIGKALARVAAATLCTTLAVTTVLAAGPGDQAVSRSTTVNQSDASQQTPGDTRTAEEIDKRLQADPYHLFRHVNVSVQNGVARLGGFVYSSDALAKAKQIASETPGVTRVDNQMKLQRNGANDTQPD